LTYELKELQPFPYFSKPFITVAKNDQGVQFAVIYRDSNKVDVEKLPVNLEQIKQILENKGIDLSGPNGDNLHLFEIKQKIYWTFENGNGRIKLDLSGHEIKE
jgi:hypothetical protein